MNILVHLNILDPMNIIPGVPKKMIHKILAFYENSPSPNWTKLYWLDAHMIEVLIGESYNQF